MNQEQRRIFEYLNQYAVGYGNKKTSTNIRNACNLQSGGRTNEYPMKLIRELILDHGCVIGSSSGGYWIIENEDELERVVSSLDNRAEADRHRARCLR